jgi:hypothetical protein
MSESGSSALHLNADGSVIGIGGASDFARRTIRRWYVAGLCDFPMSDDDYYNPWLASRFTPGDPRVQQRDRRRFGR